MSDNLKDDIRTAIPIHKKIELKEVERLQKEVLSLQKDKEYYKKSCDEYVKRCDKLLEKNSRQKAEIERLAKGCGIITEEDENWYPSPLKTPEEIKAEAVKEFAERLKKSIKKSVDDAWHSDGNGIYDAENVLDDIDNLVKEMVGDAK